MLQERHGLAVEEAIHEIVDQVPHHATRLGPGAVDPVAPLLLRAQVALGLERPNVAISRGKGLTGTPSRGVSDVRYRLLEIGKSGSTTDR